LRLDLSFDYLESTSLVNLVSYSDAVVVATARVPQPSRTTEFTGSPLIVTDQDFVVDSVLATNGSEAVGDAVRLQITELNGAVLDAVSKLIAANAALLRPPEG
jgi:hypothetical protein